MPNITGTVVELIYSNVATGTAKASFTTEVPINDTAGMGERPVIPPYYWAPNAGVSGGIRVVARGILSSTGTPTYTFTIRLGANGSTSACIALGSAALTTGSGVSNQIFEVQGDFIVRTITTAGATSTGQGVGTISSPGLATSIASMFGGAASPGTVATLDTSITNYVNFNVACSASSPSNTITLQQLVVFGLR